MHRFQFHPVVADWFQRKFGSPTDPQEQGWPAIQSGAHTLIAAPTGSGKTLAAFLASLDALFRLGLKGELRDETHVVYVSPLKALSNDIHKNLEEPLAEIRAALKAAEGHDIEVRSAVRTGDTPAAARQALAKKPPHILVTTPESFYLLLTSESGRKMLSTVRTLIVDEIHALVGNRRGSHLALSMERLSALVPHPIQRLGLSATQKPIEEVAQFLVGTAPVPGRSNVNNQAEIFSANSMHSGEAAERGCVKDQPQQLNYFRRGRQIEPPCQIINTGHKRALDLAIELPGSPLEAVMSNEVWAEVYQRLGELIQQHRTTLVFVNTRRMAERVTANLCEILGADQVTSHHGSLSAKLRLDAENRLKRGELKALVATASLELGIDIGSVDLVCQLGTTRSIATLLQRVGRAEHRRGGLPKGRLFPLTRDELVECVAALHAVRHGDLDRLIIPEKPLDILAQQIVAAASAEDWKEDDLFNLMRAAYPYRQLTHEEFDEVVRMLAQGFSTKRGHRSALVHHDAVNHRIRGRRGSRLLALTSGGAIPDNTDYRVVLEPSQTFIGTVNEDFAVESMAGEIFQLGNASWKILQIVAGTVRVEDAHGQPPGIPFWLGEAPARTHELSHAVSRLREDVEQVISKSASPDDTENDGTRHSVRAAGDLESAGTSDSSRRLTEWFTQEHHLPAAAARQLADYFAAAYKSLGALPSQDTLIMERFFDESGGMQLVIHSPFGARLNRAWGLALRKRFCRSFNFELQSAATDDAIVLSLGTQHSFPLEEVFRYLNSKTVRDILVQALLDAPMFPIRWRWNATRSLALPRTRGGKKVPAPLQRMESENLLAAVFPDQLACLENIVGDREVPDHPLVKQTIDDCLTEAMDINALEHLLRRIETNKVRCLARDLPEPSLLAHEILNARPYAFLDNAPLEERRTQAVYTRRASDSATNDGLGILDAAAIDRVCADAWPRASNSDELHEILLLLGVVTDEEVARCVSATNERSAGWSRHGGTVSPIDNLRDDRRAARFTNCPYFWVAAERLPMVRAVYPTAETAPPLIPPDSEAKRQWERPDALRELVRGRMEISGPITVTTLAAFFHLLASEIEQALLALEAEGFVLRGKFRPGATEIEWCDRRLLARIHRLTINRLRAEIQPVTVAEFQRFLLAWQHVSPDHKVEGLEGVQAVLSLLDGYEVPAAGWEPAVLASRVKEFTPQWLDQLCFTGRVGWGRLSPPQNIKARGFAPLRSSPIALFAREHLHHWLQLSPAPPPAEFSPDTDTVLKTLAAGGALFFGEIVQRSALLQSRVEQALGELAAQGWVTADSFEGLRALLLPQEKRAPFGDLDRKRHHKIITSIEHAGRWSLIRQPSPANPDSHAQIRDEALEAFARVLLRRYGLMFRRLLERESLQVSWFELGRIYRRLEARGEIRGGHFVSGVSGEQFALPEAIGLLRSLRKNKGAGQLVMLSAADPLNLVGILTPGPRLAAIAANRLLLRDGVPIAALEAGKVLTLATDSGTSEREIEQSLKVATLPPALRRYYH